MFKVINKIVQNVQAKKAKKRIAKLAAIKSAVVEFYEALNAAKGGVNIPACIQARKAMQENIKSEKDINRVYKSLVAYRKNQKKAVA